MSSEQQNDVGIEVQTLDNGLRVVRAPRPVGSTSIVIHVMTGSRSENDALAGGCHLMEHLFFKGTAKRPGANDITIEMDGLGADFNAMTGVESTIFQATSPGRFGARSAEVMADMVLNAAFRPDDFEDEKPIVLEERRGRLDDPQTVAFETLSELAFGDTPVGRSVIGTPESIMGLDHTEVLDHIRRHYVPSNIIVGIGGRFDEETVETLVAPFAALPAAEAPELAPYTPPARTQHVRAVRNDLGQTTLALSLPGVGINHPDRAAFEILTGAIGGGPSSRLFLEIRERLHMAYQVMAMPLFYVDTGAWAVMAGVEPVNTDAALVAIVDELIKVRDHGLGQDEIDRARTQLIARHEGSLDSADRLLEWAIESLANSGELPPFSQYEEQLQAVTVDDLARVAEYALDMSEMRIVAIGPGVSTGRLADLHRTLVDTATAGVASSDDSAAVATAAPTSTLSDAEVDALVARATELATRLRSQFPAGPDVEPSEAEMEVAVQLDSEARAFDAELAAVSAGHPRLALAQLALAIAFMPPPFMMMDGMGEMGEMDGDMGPGTGMDMGMPPGMGTMSGPGMDMDMDMGPDPKDLIAELSATVAHLPATHDDWSLWLRINAGPHVYADVPVEHLRAVAGEHADADTATLAGIIAEVIELMMADPNGPSPFDAIDALQTRIDALGADLADAAEELNGALEEARRTAESAEALRPGQPAPAFELPMIGGGTATIDRYAGRYLLIDFTASWCGPCHEFKPELVDLHRRYGRDISFLGVAVDDDPAALRAYLDQYGVVWEFAAMDEESASGLPYAVPGIPHLVLVGPDGKVIDAYLQAKSATEIDGILDDIVAGMADDSSAAPAGSVDSASNLRGEPVGLAIGDVVADSGTAHVELMIEVESGWYLHAPGSSSGLALLGTTDDGAEVPLTVRNGIGDTLEGRVLVEAAVPITEGRWALDVRVQPCSGDTCRRPTTIHLDGDLPSVDA